MSDLERLDEALMGLDHKFHANTVLVPGEEYYVMRDAARAYRDLLANGVEPDYEAGLDVLIDKWWEPEASDLAVFTEAVDAAIGNKLLVDSTTEEEE